MPLSFINILSSILIFQLLLLVLFLLTSTKGKRLSNRILAFFFLWFAFNLIDGLLSYYGFYERFPAWAHIEDGFILLVGPTLYFYTLSMVYKDFAFKKSHWLHLVPFLLVTALFQLSYHLQPEEYQKQIQSAIVRQELPLAFYFSISLIYAHVSVYLFLAFAELGRYRLRIKDQFSSIHRINLNWLIFMLGSIAFILVVSIVYTFLPATGLRQFFEQSFFLPFLFILFFTNAVVWKGLKQPAIFSGIEYSTEKEDRKYAGSQMAVEEMNQIRERLDRIVVEQKPWLDPDLRIDQLAGKTNTSAKKLSQVIHRSLQQNFFDFINTHRIEEAKKIMNTSQDPKLTVL